MTWLSLLPHEMQPGDHWGAEEETGSWRIIESIEPVESPSQCRVLFTDGTDKVWPLEAPMRMWRPNTEELPHKETP
jgi:hypothetical protein